MKDLMNTFYSGIQIQHIGSLQHFRMHQQKTLLSVSKDRIISGKYTCSLEICSGKAEFHLVVDMN